MSYQRIITVYENIPLEMIEDQLSDEELLIAKIIQSFIDSKRSYISQNKEQSWDEYLVNCYLLSGDDESSYIELESLVITKLSQSNNSWIKIQAQLKEINPMKMGFLNSQAMRDELIAKLDTIEDELANKIADLLWYTKLKPASIEGLRYWMLYSSRASTSKTLERTTEAQKKTIASLKKDNHNIMRALIRSHDKALDRQLRALCRVIKELGYNPHTFEPSNKSITTQQLFEKCKGYSWNLFGKIESKDSFRTNIWSAFRRCRDDKKLDCQDE